MSPELVETLVYAVSAVVALAGALGVVFSRNPVHAALGLVATLFAIAVLFLNQNAQFLGVVQVIVYTGAIVVLILFVIMLLGVDKEEDLETEPLVGQRSAAVLFGIILILGLGAVFVVNRTEVVTGEVSATQPIVEGLSGTNAQEISQEMRALPPEVTQAVGEDNIGQIGGLLFTDYAFAFQITAALLTIAVVGAVLMARKPKRFEPMPELEDELDEGLDELSSTAGEGT